MKCTLDGNNTRALAKAVQCLSKIGSQLFLEAECNGLNLRSTNSSHTAIANIRFSRKFFETFHLKNAKENCKISMKAWLSIFRNMKQVERCEIVIMDEEAKFQVHLKCKLDTVKKALISIVDEQGLSQDPVPNSYSKIICGTYKLFTEITNNFSGFENELTFDIKSDYLYVKNYVDKKSMKPNVNCSKIKLRAHEFETFEVPQNSIITFCLKEFRAFLLFAEWLYENIQLKFDETGKPLYIHINKSDLIDCLLTMSSLKLNESQIYYEENVNEINNTFKILNRQKKRKIESEKLTCARNLYSDEKIVNYGNSTAESELFNFKEDNDKTPPNLSNFVQNPRLLCDATHFENNDVILMPMNVDENEVYSGPQVVYYNTEETIHSNKEQRFIPQSPKDNTFVRTVFSRCFQSTFIAPEPKANNQMYAPGSDTEDE